MCNSQSQLKFSVSKFEFSILIFAETVSESAKKQLFFAGPTPLRLFFSALLRFDLNCCALDIYIVVIVYLCIPVSKPGNVRLDPVTLP